MQILANISKRKGNQTIKFGQLIEYNMTNTFFQKPCKKCGGETIIRPFSKETNLNISLGQSTKVLL